MRVGATMDRRFTAYKWLTGLGAAGVQSLIYFGVGHLTFARSTELLRLRLDDAIPFWPWTSWLYLPIYAGIFVIALSTFQTRQHFDRALWGVALIMTLGLTGHLLVRAEYPRPVLRPPFANVSEVFLAWVQSIDRPGNVFPSLHVAHTSSLALILHHEQRLLGRWVIGLALVLAASTLTTKQHFILDVVSGFALAGLARWLVLRGIPTPRPAPSTSFS